MIMTIDIGGTKTLRAWWDKGHLVKKELYPTASIKDYTLFIMEHTRDLSIDALCLAMAGPVTGHQLELTNTGQIIHLNQIKNSVSHIPQILFLNDLEALGHSLKHLGPEQLYTFRKGWDSQSPSGTKAVVSVGTGLGICAVTKEGLVIPSEGGHTDFAPRDPQQRQILDFLERRYGHVSYERILSGQGLVNLYEALTGTVLPAPDQITARAFDREPEALEAIRLFTRILAAACGNTALTFMSAGGVYLAGGIIPKILPLLDKSLFESAFLHKGRFEQWLRQVPVYAVLDEMAPSIGAAACGESALRI